MDAFTIRGIAVLLGVLVVGSFVVAICDDFSGRITPSWITEIGSSALTGLLTAWVVSGRTKERNP